jgi:hypothetical protein
MKARGCLVDVVSTDDPMWLYCRHKQADSAFEKGRGDKLAIGIAELGDAFGIDVAGARQYIRNSNHYGYCRVMQKFARRGKLTRELREIGQQLREHHADNRQIAQLEERQEEITADLADLAENLTHSPGYTPGANESA